MLIISHHVRIPESEIEMYAIRAQGSGGQNVNKLSTAIHLRFDIKRSSLPEFYKERLLGASDQRISQEGIIVIKAQQYRTLEKNREDALLRLQALIKRAAMTQKKRKPTRPTRASQRKRLEAKTKQKQKKSLRRKIDF